MKRAAAILVAATGWLSPSTPAAAQVAEDPMAALRACSLMERTERLACMEKASRGIASASRGAVGWTVSQTTSPVDYSPIAVASVPSEGGTDGMKLWLRCRGGQTEIAVTGPSLTGRAGDYVVSYRIGESGPTVAAAVPSSGPGVAIGGDTLRLLQSLPDGGRLGIRLAVRSGAAVEATFALAGLDAVRARLAEICRWPRAIATPHE